MMLEWFRLQWLLRHRRLYQGYLYLSVKLLLQFLVLELLMVYFLHLHHNLVCRRQLHQNHQLHLLPSDHRLRLLRRKYLKN